MPRLRRPGFYITLRNPTQHHSSEAPEARHNLAQHVSAGCPSAPTISRAPEVRQRLAQPRQGLVSECNPTTLRSTGGAAEVSPARQGWVSECNPTTLRSTGGAAEVSPARQGWVSECNPTTLRSTGGAALRSVIHLAGSCINCSGRLLRRALLPSSRILRERSANGHQPDYSFREKLSALFRFLDTLVRSINLRADRAPFPDLDPANMP